MRESDEVTPRHERTTFERAERDILSNILQRLLFTNNVAFMRLKRQRDDAAVAQYHLMGTRVIPQQKK